MQMTIFHLNIFNAHYKYDVSFITCTGIFILFFHLA